MIIIQDLQKKQGRNFQLSIDNLQINQGESFGLLGNNGAGKTTLFRLILDLIEPNSGTISINRKPVNTTEDWKFLTGSFLDESFLIDYLSALEYFEMLGKLKGVSKESLLELIRTHRSFLGDDMFVKGKLIRDLSKGNKSKVGIFSAIIGTPQIIILDEPFANLDPSSQIKLKEILKKKQNEEGTTLLISSHDLKHMSEVSTRIVILHNGQIVKDENTNENTLKDLETYFSKFVD
jgi:ABC-2 type transport system ATP-binding protein